MLKSTGTLADLWLAVRQNDISRCGCHGGVSRRNKGTKGYAGWNFQKYIELPRGDYDLTILKTDDSGIDCDLRRVPLTELLAFPAQKKAGKTSLVLWLDSIVCTVNISPNVISHIRRLFVWNATKEKHFHRELIYWRVFSLWDCESLKLTWIIVTVCC